MADLRYRLGASALRLLPHLPPRVRRLLAGRPRRLDGRELHVDVQLVLRLQRLSRIPQIPELPLLRAREAMVAQAEMVGGRPPVAAHRDLEVDGATGRLPARLYTPSACLGLAQAPTVLFFHGGGWIYGDLATHDSACRVIAEAGGVQVLAVDYRLGPEHVFPAGLLDCRAAYRWLVEHHAEVGADPARLAVAGDSAGGWMAANVAVTAAEEGLPLALQLLIYPGTDFLEDAPSKHTFQDEGLILTRAFLDNARELGFDPGTDFGDPEVSPLRRTRLPAGLAPAQVVTAGFDPLRDEGAAYARLLQEQGVVVTHVEEPDLVHGYLHMTALGRELPRRVAALGERLGAALGG